MGNNALGLLEVLGYSTALACIDSAAKATNITVVGMDCNNPKAGDAAQIPVVVQVRMVGSIDDVREALEVSKYTALRYLDEKDIKVHFISSYDSSIDKIIRTGKVKLK